MGGVWIGGPEEGLVPKTAEIQVEKINLQSHYFKINMTRRPQKVTVELVTDKRLLENLEVHCGLPVGVRANKDDGVVYRVDRSVIQVGVPNHVTIQEIWDRIPATADGLTIGFGMASNSRPIYYILADMHHLLIAGTTGGGKSNQIKSILMYIHSPKFTETAENTPD